MSFGQDKRDDAGRSTHFPLRAKRRGSSSTIVAPTLASVHAAAVHEGQPADLQRLLTEALEALAKERVEKAETAGRLAEERRNREEAEGKVLYFIIRSERDKHNAVRNVLRT